MCPFLQQFPKIIAHFYCREELQFKDSPFTVEEELKRETVNKQEEGNRTGSPKEHVQQVTTQLDFCSECDLHNFIAEMKVIWQCFIHWRDY